MSLTVDEAGAAPRGCVGGASSCGQHFELSELRLSADTWLHQALGLELQLPMRALRTFGGEPGEAGVDSETAFGLADAWLAARGRVQLGSVWLSGRLGAAVPTGNWREGSAHGHSHGAAHQEVRFGTGTVMPLVALEGLTRVGEWEARLYGQALLGLWENEAHEGPGHRLQGGVELRRVLPGGARLSVGLDLVREFPETTDGLVGDEATHLGRTDVLAGAGLTVPLGRVTAMVAVRIPLYQALTSAPGLPPSRLAYPALLVFAVQGSASLPGFRP